MCAIGNLYWRWTAGADGMDFYRRLVREGARHLREGGLLAVETGAEQGGAVSRLLNAEGPASTGSGCGGTTPGCPGW